MTTKFEIATNAAASAWEDITGLVNWETAKFGGSAHRGEIFTANGFDLLDDAGNRTIPNYRVVRITETATTPDTVLFRGRTIGNRTARGVIVTEPAKVFDVSLVDHNKDFGGQAFVGTSRPAEDDDDRVRFLLETYLQGQNRASTDLLDTYLQSTTPVALPAYRYEAVAAIDWFNHIIESTGKQFFITVDSELFYGPVTSTVYAADLAITDVLPAGADEYYPIDAAAFEDGGEMFTGVRRRISGGRVITTVREAVETANDRWRTGIIDEEVQSVLAATTRNNKFLDEFDHTQFTYTCAIDLDESEVDKIKYGQTVSVRSAAMGLLSPTTLRIGSLQWTKISADRYRANLELGYPTKFGRRSGGTGSTTPTPGPTPFIPGTNEEPGADPGEGDLYTGVDNAINELYVNGTSITPGINHTTAATVADGILVAGDNVVAAKIENGVGATWWGGNGTQFEMRIFNEDGDLLAYTTASAKVLPLENSGGTLNAEPANWETAAFDDSGWADAEDVTGSVNSLGSPMFVDPIAPARNVAPPGAKASSFSDLYAVELIWLVRINFTSGVVSPNVPTVGMQVTESAEGDGSETCFTTNYPYMQNSLEVFVGGVAVVPEQTDPEAGEFCLPFAPAIGAQIIIRYQAADGTPTGSTNNPNPTSTVPAGAPTDLSWKAPARVATTANVTIATALNDGDTIDGVTLALSDRVLVKSQTAAEENGIYVVGPTPSRAADFDTGSEVLGAAIYVIAGTANAGQVFTVTNTTAPVVGTDDITFAALTSTGSVAALDDVGDVNAPTPADGDVLTWDDGASEWVAAASTAGGITVEDEGTPLSTAATTLDFVGAGVTASGSGASKTITIPGGGSSVVHEDFWTPPDSAGTYDEEFAGTADTLPTNWSWTTEPTGSNAWKLNSRWKRCLIIERAASDTTTFDLRRTSLTPGAIDIGFWWYMDVGLGRWNNNQDTLEVLFRDSSGNAGFGIKLLKSSILAVASRDRTGGVTSDVAVENASNNDTRMGLFCGVTRKTSDNTWRAMISSDGRAWTHLGVTTTRSVTIDHMQFTATSGGNQGTSRIIFGPLRSRADLLEWAPR